jgi:hypothetical protein
MIGLLVLELTLTLFKLWILFVDDINNTLAAYNFAIRASLFY